MTDSPDMHTEPKTDQLNYDHIPNGETKTITITRVTGNADPQQPISVHYDGGDGKPYKPGLSMRRIMEAVWGKHAIEYVGKSMTLFGDPTVRFGPNAVGGIRISHASHLDKDLTFLLTVSKGIKKPYTIKQLKVDMGNVDEEIDDDVYADIMKKAQDSAGYGSTEYKEYFMSLNPAYKKMLNDSGDHEKLKTIAKANDKEIPADPPTSRDEEAGTVEPDVTAPQSTGSTTPEPFDLIRDDDKRLAPDEIISTLNQYHSAEDVRHFLIMHTNFIEEMTTNDQKTILNARDKKIKELSDA